MIESPAPRLRDIPSTLLITVWARARASAPPLAIIDDPHARSLVMAHPEAFACFERLRGPVRRWTVVGVGVRTQCFDRATREFLARHPDGVVVNLGCGLDARSRRLDQGRATWFDVDVPEVQAWRRSLFPDDARHTALAGSLTAPREWLDRVDTRPGQAVLFLCEGTLMYFDEPEVRALMTAVLDRFPRLTGFIELIGDIGVGRVHPLVRAVGSNDPFRSGARDPAAALASWDPRIRVTSKESLYQHEPPLWGPLRWVVRLFPSLHDRFGSVLVGFGRAEPRNTSEREAS